MDAAAAFEAIGEQQISAPRKARTRAAARAAGKRLREREQQAASWRRWQMQCSEALLAGPYAPAAHDLIEFLEAMTLEAGEPELVERINRGPWFGADPDTRYAVLTLIDGAIAAVRERNDLPPFSDALPGEPETVFQIVR